VVALVAVAAIVAALAVAAAKKAATKRRALDRQAGTGTNNPSRGAVDNSPPPSSPLLRAPGRDPEEVQRDQDTARVLLSRMMVPYDGFAAASDEDEGEWEESDGLCRAEDTPSQQAEEDVPEFMRNYDAKDTYDDSRPAAPIQEGHSAREHRNPYQWP
jgi:hypothetical protein